MITFRGIPGEISIQNWFLGDSFKLDTITTENIVNFDSGIPEISPAATITRNQIDNLVNAMASFNDEHQSNSELTSELRETINNHWQLSTNY